MIFAFVLLAILILVVMSGMGFFLSDIMRVSGRYARTGGPRLDEVILEDNGAANKIAVVEIEGIISQLVERGGHNMVEVVKAQLKQAGEDRKVRAVVLKVNSPGGEVLASDEINRAITEFQEKDGKPLPAATMSPCPAAGLWPTS
jgi:protease-4